MADAVGLYATAMNDLGNIESIRSEPLNCQGGQPWVQYLLITGLFDLETIQLFLFCRVEEKLS